MRFHAAFSASFFVGVAVALGPEAPAVSQDTTAQVAPLGTAETSAAPTSEAPTAPLGVASVMGPGVGFSD